MDFIDVCSNDCSCDKPAEEFLRKQEGKKMEENKECKNSCSTGQVEFSTVVRGTEGYKETKRGVLEYLNDQNYEFSEEFFKKKVYAVAVAKKDGQIVGSICLKRLCSTITELGYIYTLPAFRHKGIAKELTSRITPLINTPFAVAATKEPFLVNVVGNSVLSTGVNEETGNTVYLTHIK